MIFLLVYLYLFSVNTCVPELIQTNPREEMADTGIPECALDLECPDLDLKVALLQEFILVDGKYVEKLNELEGKHLDALR